MQLIVLTVKGGWLWPGEIFNCFAFLVKKHAAFKWKDAISRYPVSPGSAEALVRLGGKITNILIADFISNIYAKNCRTRIVYVKIIASQMWNVFWDTVHVYIFWVLSFQCEHVSLKSRPIRVLTVNCQRLHDTFTDIWRHRNSFSSHCNCSVVFRRGKCVRTPLDSR